MGTSAVTATPNVKRQTASPPVMKKYIITAATFPSTWDVFFKGGLKNTFTNLGRFSMNDEKFQTVEYGDYRPAVNYTVISTGTNHQMVLDRATATCVSFVPASGLWSPPYFSKGPCSNTGQTTFKVLTSQYPLLLPPHYPVTHTVQAQFLQQKIGSCVGMKRDSGKLISVDCDSSNSNWFAFSSAA